MKNKLLIVFCTVLLLFSVSYATDIGDDMRFENIVTFDGVIQEQTDKTDGTSICFEGTTDDAYETCFLFTDPTADRTVTFGDSTFSAGATNAHTDIVTITKVTAGTNTVQDALTIDISGADTTTGFGAAIVFKLEDDTGTTTEEHGRVDFVMTDATSTTEDTDVVVSQMVNGDVTETFRLVAAESATAGDYFQFTSNTTELNAEITTGMFKLLSVGTEVAGLGATHEYWMVDAGGSEIQAEFATLFTTITDGAEDVDLVWRQNDNGSLNETLRIVADADGTTEGTRMEFTSNSAETDGVNDLLVLKASGGTTVAGFGVGIDLQGEFADGVETACKMEAVWTDVGTGSEDADFVMSCKDAGTTAELARFTSDGVLAMEGSTSDGIQALLTLGTDPASSDKTITIPSSTTAALMISALTTNDVDVANSIWGVSNGLAFGGSTGANGFEVTVSPGADPGADVALTLPTASGAIPTIIGASSISTVEAITATDIQTIADCGKTLILTHATVAIVVTLPAIAGSTGCEFWVRHGLATNQDHTVVTNASDNIIMGSTIDNNTPPGSYQAAGDLVTFVNSAESVGDYIHVISNGVNWFLDGVAELNGGITQGST
ncbi:hypothetical protein LCGC14_1561770 [marine sediment metagenome]|uniref:Uncharacterized protein n=1 Tax=marine sediment metagenome TaxID=412755 RepID=A0A0F9IM79_9ZZZZ